MNKDGLSPSAGRSDPQTFLLALVAIALAGLLGLAALERACGVEPSPILPPAELWTDGPAR